MTKQFQSEAKLTFWTLKTANNMFFNAFSGFYWWVAHIDGAPDKQEKPDLTDFHFELRSSVLTKNAMHWQNKKKIIFIIQAQIHVS